MLKLQTRLICCGKLWICSINQSINQSVSQSVSQSKALILVEQNVTEYNVERVQCTIDNQFSLLGRSCVVVVADCSGGCWYLGESVEGRDVRCTWLSWTGCRRRPRELISTGIACAIQAESDPSADECFDALSIGGRGKRAPSLWGVEQLGRHYCSLSIHEKIVEQVEFVLKCILAAPLLTVGSNGSVSFSPRVRFGPCARRPTYFHFTSTVWSWGNVDDHSSDRSHLENGSSQWYY